MSEWTDSQPTQEQDELLHKYLVFSVDESYALELSKVREIMEYKPITRVPETPAYIVGVMNRHGSVVPVIDMRKRFHQPDLENASRRCTIIIRFDGGHLGLLVDNVTDLIDIAPEMISPPPQVGKSYSHVFIKAIGIYKEQMVMIVDADKLVNLDDLAALPEELAEEEPAAAEKKAGRKAKK